MSNPSMLAAVRAATHSDPFPGAPATVVVDPFPGVPCTGIGLVTSAYPGDSLLLTTPRRVAGASAAAAEADASRDSVAEPTGGIQIHHAGVTFSDGAEPTAYGPESIKVLESLAPPVHRPKGYVTEMESVVGTGADRRSAFATAASSACGTFGEKDGLQDDGMMRMPGGMRA